MITIKHGEELLWYDMLKYKSNSSAANLTGVTAKSEMRTIPEGELVLYDSENLNNPAPTEVPPGTARVEFWASAAKG